MEIQLKNIKYAAFASEETNCFSANVYIDGKKVCQVENEGRGGCHRWSDDGTTEKLLNEAAKLLPPKDISYFYKDNEKHLIDMDGESIIDELIESYLKKKDTANKVLFRSPKETYDLEAWSVIKGKLNPELREQIVKKYGQETVFLSDEIKETITIDYAPKKKVKP